MKVLHISGARTWGGNEQQLIDFVRELSSLGVENIVYGVKGSPLQARCLENNTAFIEVKKGKLNKIANYFDLKKVVKQIQPDLIHLHTSDSLTVYTISDMLCNLKTKAVFSKKGMGSRSSILSKFKYNYKNVAAIICVSGKVQEDFSTLLTPKNKVKTTVVHDCVSPADLDTITTVDDVREKFAISEGSYIVGNIANHTAAKDLHTLIDTANYLVNVKGRKDVVFVQIGEFTKLTDELKAQVAEKQLQNHVYFTGKVARAYNFNRQFDAFLMTSQREGGPTSVLEAMYLGVPVVSTNVGVVPDVIVDGTNGYIAPLKDYKTLADKLDALLANEALRKDFSEKSRAIIQNGFTVKVLAPQVLQVYQKVAGS